MKPAELKTWLGIGALILAAGMWLGSLHTRVAQLEKDWEFAHGAVHAPKER